MDELEVWKNDNERLERLLPELGCLMKIDSIMTAYVPHKLSDFGVSPVLPSIYALRVIVEEGNCERYGEAIVLLQYIHSHFPDVSSRTYVALLVDLKTMATFYGIRLASDDEEKCAFLDKFFPLEACSDSEVEDCTSIEEYSARLHGHTRSRLEKMISSQLECWNFQCKQVLCLDHGMQLHKNLLIALQSYLSDIRSQLPCPKLLQWSETYRSREEQSTRTNHTAEWDLPEDTEAVLSPPPQQRVCTNDRGRHEVPISLSDQRMLSESHPARTEVVLAPGTVSLPKSSHTRSQRLLEKGVQKFTGGASSSSKAPQMTVKTTGMLLRSSTILTDDDDSGRTDSPMTYRPPKRKRLASKKSRSNSKAGSRKKKPYLAGTRKAPGSMPLKTRSPSSLIKPQHVESPIHSFDVRIPSKDVPIISPPEDATVHIGLVEEEVITQDSDEVYQVSRHKRQRKRVSTENESGNDTDTLAPARKQAKLSSSTQGSEYGCHKRQARAQGKLEQTVRRLQKRHTARKWQYGPSVVIAKINLGQKSTDEKKRESESRSRMCSENEGVEHPKQNSKLPFPLAPAVSYPPDGAVGTHTLEHSQPETINLIDEEIEFTQNGTQYNYGPVEKVAYETSLSDRSETVISDSTASLSPIYGRKRSSFLNLYGFQKRC